MPTAGAPSGQMPEQGASLGDHRAGGPLSINVEPVSDLAQFPQRFIKPGFRCQTG